MRTFSLTVSTPGGNCFQGECVKLDVRGELGSLAIMAGHIPFVTGVSKGDCSILLDDGTKLSATLDGGILTVDRNQTTLIAGSFCLLKD